MQIEGSSTKDHKKMQGMWKNIFIFLIFKAVAQILPGMSGKAETLTLRPVIPKRLTGAIHEGNVCYSTDPLEFEAFLRDFQRKNPSGTAFAPFAKRIQHGRTQVTIHAFDRA